MKTGTGLEPCLRGSRVVAAQHQPVGGVIVVVVVLAAKANIVMEKHIGGIDAVNESQSEPGSLDPA